MNDYACQAAFHARAMEVSVPGLSVSGPHRTTGRLVPGPGSGPTTGPTTDPVSARSPHVRSTIIRRLRMKPSPLAQHTDIT